MFPISSQDLLQHLTEQRNFLQNSCILYDQGHFIEAKRIATIISTLVYDNKYTSLLQQIQLKDKINYLSTCNAINEQTDNSLFPLTFGFPNQQGNFTPRFLLPPNPTKPDRWVGFDEWWEKDIIYRASAPNQFVKLNRKTLVQTMRDQDGGAHVDGSIKEESYFEIVYGEGAGWTSYLNGKLVSLTHANAHFATMRQIGYEIELTLKSVNELN